MGQFIQLVVDGFANGSIYASLALALVLVRRSTGMINFAQGAMGVFTTYIALFAWSGGAIPSPIASFVALVFGFLVGALLQWGVVRRFDVRNPQTATVVSISLFMLVTGLCGALFGYVVRDYPPLFPSGVVQIGPAVVGVQSLGTAAVVIVVVVLLQLLFYKTKLGLALRAVADNPTSSLLVGMNVSRLLMIGWGLAAVLGALAGVLVAPKVYLFPQMMDQVLVYALAAAILGGLDSPIGAVIAGWLIGVVEALAGVYVDVIGSDLKIAVPLLAIFVVLLVRPQGLLGRKEVVRV
jgi:branched-chain amino acid transport system permease protein